MNPRPDRVLHGVGNRRGNWRDGVLANGLALERAVSLFRRNQRRYQLGNIYGRGYLHISKAKGRDSPLFRLKLFHQGVSQPLDHCPVDLPLVTQRVVDGAHVVGGDYPVYGDLTRFRVNLHIRHLGTEGGDLRFLRVGGRLAKNRSPGRGDGSGRKLSD